MKNIVKKVNFWNLFIGIVVGLFAGLFVFSWLVPSGDEAIMFYKIDKKNGIDKMMEAGSTTYRDNSTDNRGYTSTTYKLGDVTSEKQYLERMKVHHEVSIIMSQQVLALNPTADTILLAKNIISAESSQLQNIKDWLAAAK
jgi:uncharacterized protein (DUF305 family)